MRPRDIDFNHAFNLILDRQLRKAAAPDRTEAQRAAARRYAAKIRQEKAMLKRLTERGEVTVRPKYPHGSKRAKAMAQRSQRNSGFIR